VLGNHPRPQLLLGALPTVCVVCTLLLVRLTSMSLVAAPAIPSECDPTGNGEVVVQAPAESPTTSETAPQLEALQSEMASVTQTTKVRFVVVVVVVIAVVVGVAAAAAAAWIMTVHIKNRIRVWRARFPSPPPPPLCLCSSCLSKTWRSVGT
jgi:hypothetical protein